MTLFTRLLISHWGPVAILTLALALVLSALFRISVVLTTLSDSELDTLQDEGRLHRAAWELDVEMRHGQLACAHGEPATHVRPGLERRVIGSFVRRSRACTWVRRSAPPCRRISAWASAP